MGTEEMVDRLPEELVSLARAHVRPAFVLLLGGTNDIGHMTACQILKNLSRMRDEVVKVQARPVALAIPCMEEGFSPTAVEVNSALSEAAHSEQHGFIFVDIAR